MEQESHVMKATELRLGLPGSDEAVKKTSNKRGSSEIDNSVSNGEKCDHLISHMFFADDTYIYCKANSESSTRVSEILGIFERGSGQQINRAKSSVFYSKNTDDQTKQEVHTILAFNEANEGTQYLGLPNILQRKKSAVLGYLKDRLSSKIQGWDKKTLSKGGKETLLKTVAQTIPNYAMSVFILPKELCKDLEQLMNKLWWKSSKGNKKGIHWMCWDKISKRKSQGGLGFRHIYDFNVALLGKQGWRLIIYPESLVSRVYKARYYSGGSFINASLGSNPSYIWRSIMESQNLLKQGLGCKVGNGTAISIMKDPWLPSISDPYIHTRSEAIEGQMVSSLLDENQIQWDVDLVEDIFEERDARLILNIPLHNRDADTWYWRQEKSGHYSVKTAYSLLQDSRSNDHSSDNSGFWRKLWNLKIPTKVKHFLWSASTNCLPTKDLLKAKRVMVNELCPVCNEFPESTVHILATCSFAIECFVHMGKVVRGADNSDFMDWLKAAFEQYTEKDIQKIAMLCWALWKGRNDIVWNQRSMQVTDVVVLAISTLNQWLSAQDKQFNTSLGLMTQEDGKEHWTVPEVNKIKINTDAAIFENSQCFSYSMVARNHEGNLVEAFSKCNQGRINPEMAEAIGVREALSWIKKKNWRDVEVETDSLVSVQAIRSKSVMLSYFGRIIEECKKALEELKDSNISLRFVKRSANNVAHFIARHTSVTAERIWSADTTHSELRNVILKDLKF